MISIKNQKLISLFGDRVRKLRIQKGYSMRDLAAYADIEYSQISKIETGKINTTISTAYAISQALEVSLESLFKLPV